MQHHTIIIANEYDERLMALLTRVLRQLNAVVVSQETALAGSQDFYRAHVLIGGLPVEVERETYIGITLTGAAEVLSVITERMTSQREAGER